MSMSPMIGPNFNKYGSEDSLPKRQTNTVDVTEKSNAINQANLLARKFKNIITGVGICDKVT